MVLGSSFLFMEVLGETWCSLVVPGGPMWFLLILGACYAVGSQLLLVFCSGRGLDQWIILTFVYPEHLSPRSGKGEGKSPHEAVITLFSSARTVALMHARAHGDIHTCEHAPLNARMHERSHERTHAHKNRHSIYVTSESPKS